MFVIFSFPVCLNFRLVPLFRSPSGFRLGSYYSCTSIVPMAAMFVCRYMIQVRTNGFLIREAFQRSLSTRVGYMSPRFHLTWLFSYSMSCNSSSLPCVCHCDNANNLDLCISLMQLVQKPAAKHRCLDRAASQVGFGVSSHRLRICV